MDLITSGGRPGGTNSDNRAAAALLSPPFLYAFPSPYWQAPFAVQGRANVLHKGHKAEEQKAGINRGGGGAKAAGVRLPAPVLAEVA